MPDTTLGQVLPALTRRLAGAGSESPRLEAELLAGHVLGMDRIAVRVHTERQIPAEAAQRLEGLVLRRLEGVPMAYLLGEREFYSRPFLVCPGVLVPRPETEMLVETVLEERRADAAAPLRFADICTGTGCIGITLALERPHWQGLLLDLHPGPCRTALANAAALGVANLPVVRADLFAAPLGAGSLDILVSNPPYIAREEVDEVAPDVLAHEPQEALFAENHGLAALAGVISLAARTLVPGGLVVLEHGHAQGEKVRRLLAEQNFFEIFTKKDLAGLDRMTMARL